MPKIVRLTESDLTRLVKKIVKEQADNTLDEPHYQFDRKLGMILLRGAHSRQVKKILSNLPTNLTWLAIADCEFADFNGVDLCSFPDLKNVNLIGTENNLEEQDYECLDKWDERGQYGTL